MMPWNTTKAGNWAYTPPPEFPGFPPIVPPVHFAPLPLTPIELMEDAAAAYEGQLAAVQTAAEAVDKQRAALADFEAEHRLLEAELLLDEEGTAAVDGKNEATRKLQAIALLAHNPPWQRSDATLTTLRNGAEQLSTIWKCEVDRLTAYRHLLNARTATLYYLAAVEVRS